MKIKLVFLCFMLCVIDCKSSIGIILENFDTLAKVQRNRIEKSLILLKNENDLIPLKRLDSLRLLTVKSGNFDSTFCGRVNNYISSVDISGSDFKTIREYSPNLIIVGIDSTTTNTIDILSFLQTKKEKAKIIFIVQPSKKLNFLNELFDLGSAILFVSSSGDESLIAQDLAVQGLFGAVGINGNTDAHPVLDLGMETKSIKRLKYTIPEEVGIPSYELDQGISKIVQEGIDSMAFPGCQILVAKDSKVIFHKSFGHHTYDKQQKVLNTDIYDLASITKVTGATTALMALHDQEKINLDDKFSTYWPLFNKTNKEDLILRDVLAHNARLKSWIPYYLESRKKNGKYKAKTVKDDSSKRYPQRLSSIYFLHKDYKEKKIYKWINKTPLNEESGYVYSGLSFYVYPEMVSNLTEESYDGFLYNHFFKPLGASTLTFNPTEKFELERIVPTETDDYFRMEQIHGDVHDEGAIMMNGISGNAGLFSNANDLAKIWQMYLNEGQYGGVQYISAETINEFTRCQFCETGNRRGLGFDKPLVVYDSIKSSVAKQASPQSFGHSGYTGAFVWADPQNQLLYIFLSNRVYPTRENRKIYTMNIRPRIHTLLYELLETTE